MERGLWISLAQTGTELEIYCTSTSVYCLSKTMGQREDLDRQGPGTEGTAIEDWSIREKVVLACIVIGCMEERRKGKE